MKEIIILSVIISILGYFLGSINGAIVISRLVYKDDVRKYGSKNAGMTNMLRVYGKRAAVFTILVDFTKGMAAVAMARLVFRGQDLQFDPAYISAIFTIIGHIFPIYFKFKGGKGVATGAGVLLF
ncbi:MAG: glycerol-3-phosphate acyltransferase, partial [Oscillospiraceae bacterium]